MPLIHFLLHLRFTSLGGPSQSALPRPQHDAGPTSIDILSTFLKLFSLGRPFSVYLASPLGERCPEGAERGQRDARSHAAHNISALSQFTLHGIPFLVYLSSGRRGGNMMPDPLPLIHLFSSLQFRIHGSYFSAMPRRRGVLVF